MSAAAEYRETGHVVQRPFERDATAAVALARDVRVLEPSFAKPGWEPSVANSERRTSDPRRSGGHPAG